MSARRYRIAPLFSRATRLLALSSRRVLARAALPEDYLLHENRGLEAADWFRLLDALLAEAGDPARAVDLGRATAAGPAHPALMAFAASPDIATGLRRLATFKPLIAPIALDLSHGDGRFTVRIRAAEGSAGLSARAAMMEVAYFIELFRLFAAEDITPRQIVLPPGPATTEPLARFARCEVQMGPGPEAQLVLPDEAARVAILSADTEVFRAIEAEMTARLRLQEAEGGMADRVRREIRLVLPSGRVSVGGVARRLRISPRSLQRKLQQEGASFQQVLDRTRADLALVYLRDHKLSIDETSYLLAFRDPNSFHRAFSDWTGMTPAEARASSG